MAPTGDTPDPGRQAGNEAGARIDVPAERRALAQAHAATLGETAARVTLELPMSADVDDFRRVLASGAKP
jgi:hypothetical protein